ncbi:MAG: hypothetical protein ACRDM7_05270 [Thermoleophilaceae bacterium]
MASGWARTTRNPGNAGAGRLAERRGAEREIKRAQVFLKIGGS